MHRGKSSLHPECEWAIHRERSRALEQKRHGRRHWDEGLRSPGDRGTDPDDAGGFVGTANLRRSKPKRGRRAPDEAWVRRSVKCREPPAGDRGRGTEGGLLLPPDPSIPFYSSSRSSRPGYSSWIILKRESLVLRAAFRLRHMEAITTSTAGRGFPLFRRPVAISIERMKSFLVGKMNCYPASLPWDTRWR